MSKKITVRVPATITDIGPGFNCFSLAVNIYNFVTIEKVEEPGISVVNLNFATALPSDDKNVVLIVVRDFLINKLGYKLKSGGIRITNDFRVPLNRGLNSLVVGVIGSLIAASIFAEVEISPEEILSSLKFYQMNPHNLAAAVVGGFVISSPVDESFVVHKLDYPEDLKITLVVPEYELAGGDSTKILSQNVSMKNAVFNVSRAALFVAALCDRNYRALNLAMEDRLHQACLKRKIPGADEIAIIAKTCDTLGISFCGNGASLLMLHTQSCESMVRRFKKVYANYGIKSQSMSVAVDEIGGSELPEKNLRELQVNCSV